MNAYARDEFRAEMIDFACWVTDVDPDDEHFVAAVEFFLAYPARSTGERTNSSCQRGRIAAVRSDIDLPGRIFGRPLGEISTRRPALLPSCYNIFWNARKAFGAYVQNFLQTLRVLPKGVLSYFHRK